MFASYYFENYLRNPLHVKSEISDDLQIIIVIPSFNEPELFATLQSLTLCDVTQNSVEVLVVLNYPENQADLYEAFHNEQYKSLGSWSETNSTKSLKFIPVLVPLESKHAGVGLARKTGMDEAVFRFHKLNRPGGVVVCLDADCRVDKNYLVAIENTFLSNRKIKACSIYFEHPLDNNGKSDSEYKLIGFYELFLRYYIAGMRFAQLPYAYHTVGSCFAVRADIYCKQGGMNQRKAGEDFYFLQKIIPLGDFISLNSTCVRPSPRRSNRVPFGTGATIGRMLDENDIHYYTYNPELFERVRLFNKMLPELYHNKLSDLIINQMDRLLLKFLEMNGLFSKISEFNQNSSNYNVFRSRFFNWFDGLKMLQFLNFSNENGNSKLPVVVAANELLKIQGITDVESELSVLLDFYRRLDRNS